MVHTGKQAGEHEGKDGDAAKRGFRVVVDGYQAQRRLRTSWHVQYKGSGGHNHEARRDYSKITEREEGLVQDFVGCERKRKLWMAMDGGMLRNRSR